MRLPGLIKVKIEASHATWYTLIRIKNEILNDLFHNLNIRMVMRPFSEIHRVRKTSPTGLISIVQHFNLSGGISMNWTKKMGLFLCVFIFCLGGTALSNEGKSLFVNLTSDEINRAAMAIKLGTRVRNEQKIPVTIFLNVEGVRIADKSIPSPKHVSGKTLREMLSGFIASGGKVIVCPMCMKNVGGMEKTDLISGAVLGTSDNTVPVLFAKDATVLSY